MPTPTPDSELKNVQVRDKPLKPVNQITAAEFGQAFTIRVFPGPDNFIMTRIGRIVYAVSLKTGQAYTRPQWIESRGLGSVYQLRS